MTIQEKIDRAYVLDQKIKKAEPELKKLKAELKAYAKKTKKTALIGNKATATVSGSGRVVADPEELHNELKDRDLEHNFYGLISVKNKEAKDLLGETSFELISEKEFDAYGKIAFKKAK